MTNKDFVVSDMASGDFMGSEVTKIMTAVRAPENEDFMKASFKFYEEIDDWYQTII